MKRLLDTLLYLLLAALVPTWSAFGCKKGYNHG